MSDDHFRGRMLYLQKFTKKPFQTYQGITFLWVKCKEQKDRAFLLFQSKNEMLSSFQSPYDRTKTLYCCFWFGKKHNAVKANMIGADYGSP